MVNKMTTVRISDYFNNELNDIAAYISALSDEKKRRENNDKRYKEIWEYLVR